MAESTTATAPVEFKPRKSQRTIERATKAKQPNPLESFVKEALSTGEPMELDVKDSEQAKAANALLRRAQGELGCGLKIQFVNKAGKQGSKLDELGKNVVLVLFEATKQKRNRAYTAADIRAYAVARNYDAKYFEPKIHEDLRAEFKEWFAKIGRAHV